MGRCCSEDPHKTNSFLACITHSMAHITGIAWQAAVLAAEKKKAADAVQQMFAGAGTSDSVPFVCSG